MARAEHIRNPVEWFGDRLSRMTSTARAMRMPQEAGELPAIRKIGLDDIGYALRHGMDDLLAFRTDALSIVAIYPLAGIFLVAMAGTSGLLPLVFPLASGFALVGPIAGIGLYSLSRRRELQAAGKIPAQTQPAYGSITVVALLLVAIYLVWLAMAYWIYYATLGPEPPQSTVAFIRDVFTTGAGWMMIVAGIGAGFCFAVAALAIGVVSFPLVLDRSVGPVAAIRHSVRAAAANPVMMAVWGMIVTAGLVIGSLPALLGLVVVIPLLGHATWHLYRRLMPDQADTP